MPFPDPSSSSSLLRATFRLLVASSSVLSTSSQGQPASVVRGSYYPGCEVWSVGVGSWVRGLCFVGACDVIYESELNGL